MGWAAWALPRHSIPPVLMLARAERFSHSLDLIWKDRRFFRLRPFERPAATHSHSMTTIGHDEFLAEIRGYVAHPISVCTAIESRAYKFFSVRVEIHTAFEQIIAQIKMAATYTVRIPTSFAPATR